MDVSIIIVNYNVRDFLNNALISVLRALEGMEGEVFVVDNASDDGSSDLVRQVFSKGSSDRKHRQRRICEGE